VFSHADLMLPTLIRQPFSSPEWLFELKYDGFRVLTVKQLDRVRLLSRQGNDMAEAFPELVATISNFPADTLALDGELVVLDKQGVPQFERLCKRAFARKRWTVASADIDAAAIFAFDILYLDGRDCRELPLLERKAILREQVCDAYRIRCAQHIEERGEELFAEVDRLELEGIVAKRLLSTYSAGRSTHWLKVKTAAGRAREAKRTEHRRSG
jgi:bifunctional non-homologous end joining protein LigD